MCLGPSTVDFQVCPRLKIRQPLWAAAPVFHQSFSKEFSLSNQNFVTSWILRLTSFSHVFLKTVCGQSSEYLKYTFGNRRQPFNPCTEPSDSSFWLIHLKIGIFFWGFARNTEKAVAVSVWLYCDVIIMLLFALFLSFHNNRCETVWMLGSLLDNFSDIWWRWQKKREVAWGVG